MLVAPIPIIYVLSVIIRSMHSRPSISRRIAYLAGFGLPALLLLLLTLNLLTYSRLSYEQPVAEIRISQIDKDRFLALLTYGKEEKRLVLNGDQWQLDARIIKWKPWANMLGLDTRYRLERLSGRFDDPEKARTRQPRVYQLAMVSLLDIWELAQRHSAWMPAVDAAYGSSVYLPLGDELAYRISMSQSGMVARPIGSSME